MDILPTFAQSKSTKHVIKEIEKTNTIHAAYGGNNKRGGWREQLRFMDDFPSYKHRYPLSSWISHASCNSWSC
jgi:hypothetical protein